MSASSKEQPTDSPQVPERLAGAILLMRGQRVILDADLAGLYGVPVKGLIRAVKRNLDRFPADFMFQLEKQEVALLRYQFGTSNGRGGRRYAPYAFTEQGVAMLSSVLRSKRAVLVNVEIMRAFVRLRRMLASNERPGLGGTKTTDWVCAVRVNDLVLDHQGDSRVRTRVIPF